MDARLSSRLAESFIEERAPSWTKKASCAGRTTADWFSDDVADPGLKREPSFPDSVYVALAVCATCPVVRSCLELAYETTKPQSWGYASVYGKHRPACKDMTCTGCVPEDERTTWAEITLEPMHAGIFGVPALIRERLDGPNRVERCLEWLARVSRERHFTLPSSAKSDNEQTA